MHALLRAMKICQRYTATLRTLESGSENVVVLALIIRDGHSTKNCR